ncbi:MAG: TonB-dependent receptor [Acidobacteria bacterium]|nr:TonB-dependent receptor [Acidobacteriota bacterium]
MNGMFRMTTLAAVLAAAPLLAQESIGTFVGTVNDTKGQPLAQATISLAGVKVPIQRVLRTNDKGEFRVPLLPPGDYVINVAKDGYVGARAEAYLSAGSTLRQDFRLRPVKAAEAEVEVIGTAAAVDKTETKTSTNLTLEKLQNLPLGLNSYATLALSPGVVGSTAYPVVRGSIAGQSNFQVNGISVRDSVVRQGRQFEVVIDDLTEDVSVIQSPLNAKYGNSSGGIVNLVTKSGTNQFEGSFRAKLFRNSWFAGRGPLPARYGSAFASNSSAIQSDDLSRTYEVTFLGPIWKDHITFAYANRISPTVYAVGARPNMVTQGFYYVPVSGAAQIAYTYGVPTSGPNVGADVISSGQQYTNTQQYKLFWIINPTSQLEVFYTDDKLGPYFDTQYGNYDPTAMTSQSSKRPFYGINYRGTFGDNILVDARFGKKISDVRFSGGPDDPIFQRVYYSNVTTIFNTGTTAGTILTGGDPWSGDIRPAEHREANTASANLNWFNGTHSIDVGFEWLREKSYLPESSGVNRRRFYTPGRLADGTYLVYNYVGSPAQNSATFRDGAAYVAEFRPYQDGGGTGVDANNYATTTSFYLNDMWTVNNHWIVMGGLRFDQWKLTDRGGERIKSSGVSPRLMTKYDLTGANIHVFSASYAQMRGTIGLGNVSSTFARTPGNQIARYFWNQGSTTPYAVSKAEMQNPANYGYLYTIQDNDILFDMDHSLKPEVAHEYTLGYNRNFTGGGFFKVTAIYKHFADLWYSKGINAVVNVPDFTGKASVTPTGFKQILTFDPMAKRNYRGVETEWAYPMYKGKSLQIDLNGNYTINRLYSTDVWREGNVANNAARFDDAYRAAGLDPGQYNPYGENANSIHNVLKVWATMTVGAPTGIRNTFSLLGRYTSGAPYSLVNQQTIPTGTLVGAPGMPTSVNEYFNGRGKFTGPDYFTFDFQWNLFIPVKGGIQFFSYLSCNNLFNTKMPATITRTASGTLHATPDPNPTYAAASFTTWGQPTALQGGRTFNIDMGFKF